MAFLGCVLPLSGTRAIAAGPGGGEDFNKKLDEAVALARGGDRERGEAAFSELAREYPGEAAVFYNWALVYEFDADGNRYRGENLNLATAYYRQALAVDPAFLPARLNLAVVLHRLGYLNDAAAEYRVVIKAGGPLAAPARYNLALVLKSQNRPGEAAAVLEEIKPYDEPAYVRLLALLAEDQGEVGRAIALWKRALALDSSPAYTALAVKHLQTLRGY